MRVILNGLNNLKRNNMKGTIQSNGSIIGDDDKIYDTLNVNGSILLVLSSWARVDIKDVIGKRVHFDIAKDGSGYNYGLLNNEETKIIKL